MRYDSGHYGNHLWNIQNNHANVYLPPCRLRAHACSSVTVDIKVGTVTLKPSGVLSMITEWEDTPKDGVVYDIYLLTTLASTGTVTLHRLNNLQFETNKMSYNIPSGPQNQFIAATHRPPEHFQASHWITCTGCTSVTGMPWLSVSTRLLLNQKRNSDLKPNFAYKSRFRMSAS